MSTLPPIPLPPVKEYYPFAPEPFRIAMNLRPLDLAEWLEIDREFPSQLAEKRRLLAEQHTAVFEARPEAWAGSQETLDILVAHLTHYFPQIYQIHGRTLVNQITAETWALDQNHLHPLDLAGRLVQEDLCLMKHDPAAGIYRLVGASLCFPTRWRLSEKMGHSLATIHIPTPNYTSQLAPPMDRLFDKLKVHKPVWRTNWNVLDDGSLFQPTGHGREDYETDVTIENVGQKIWLRIERQTLRRLPASQDILFTIRIYNNRFDSLANKPEVAQRLAIALAEQGEAMIEYKSMRPILDATIAWLKQVGSLPGA